MQQQLQKKKTELGAGMRLLNSVSPLEVLSRGYSITRKTDGTVVRDTKELKAGDEIETLIRSGTLTSTVTDVQDVSQKQELKQEMKQEAKTPGYKHIHLGGSDTEDTDYEIEQDWVKSIWDKVDPENVKLIRHYLNGHHAGQSGGIHVDGWTGDQYTIIVYLTPDWTPDDGGSIEFWTPNLTDEMRAMAVNTPYGFSGSPEMNIVKSYWPKAGRVVVFDARIPHVARAVEGDKFRVSLVFKCRKVNY